MASKARFLGTFALLLASASAAQTPRHRDTLCPNIPAPSGPVNRLFDTLHETRAVLIQAGGCPAFKRYAPGYSDANRFLSWSMAKTITAMLVGALVSDGRLKLDSPSLPIAEWYRPGDPRAAITLRMLLQMRSGLRHVEVGEPIEASDTNQTLFVSHTRAMAAAAIAHPLAYRPGTHFQYSSLTTIILSEIVTRTLTPSHDPRVRAAAYRTFAEQRLFAPAGIRSAVLEFDGAGTQLGGSIIHMTLDDWGRAGRLLLDGRGIGGRQVVSPAWLAFMKTPSPTNAEYGAQTWLNRLGSKEREPALFPDKGVPEAAGMLGHLGQYVIANPGRSGARGVVVVRLGHTPEGQMHPVAETLGEIVHGLDGPPR